MTKRRRVSWSYMNDPTTFGADPAVHSIWCPRWLQPMLLRALRWLGARVL